MNDKTKAFLEDLTKNGIAPHSDAIYKMAERGQFVAVVHNPGPLAREAAAGLGWNGASPVFAMSKSACDKMAMTDPAAYRFFSERPTSDHARMFVIQGEGTLLVHHEIGIGFRLEDGSTDTERKAAAN